MGKRVPLTPREPEKPGEVIKFTRCYGADKHVAVKTEDGWQATGESRVFNWDALVNWIGEDNWGSMELVNDSSD